MNESGAEYSDGSGDFLATKSPLVVQDQCRFTFCCNTANTVPLDLSQTMAFENGGFY